MVTYRKDETQRPKGWNKGAPPHVGWWVVKASFGEPGTFKAWWDGHMWSAQTCEVGEVPKFAIKRLANHKAGERGRWSNWCWLWPENARVARVNPETGEVTGSGPCPYETSGQAWPFGDVKKKPAGNPKVTQYVLMNNSRPIYVADTLQELHDRMKAMPRISWTHYEKLRNRKKA